jgi:hypothetical protein
MLGIDVSKDSLSVSLLDPITRKSLWEEVYPNTNLGVQELLLRTPCDVPWVLEAGMAYLLLVRLGVQDAQSFSLLQRRLSLSFPPSSPVPRQTGSTVMVLLCMLYLCHYVLIP